MAGTHQSLAEREGIDVVLHAALRDGTAVNSASVDMQGWDGVLFILDVGATDATVDMKAQDSPDDSSFTDITGAAVTQFAATDDNKFAELDVWRPNGRYVRVVLDPGTPAALGANTAVVAIRYGRTGNVPVPLTAKELVKVKVN